MQLEKLLPDFQNYVHSLLLLLSLLIVVNAIIIVVNTLAGHGLGLGLLWLKTPYKPRIKDGKWNQTTGANCFFL